MDMGWAVETLTRYGLWGIFIVVGLEYTSLPLPSEVILPLSGLAAAAGDLPLPLAVAVSVLAGLAGSTVCYLIGAFGGRPLLEKLLGRFPRAMRTLDTTDAWLAKMGGLSVMLARVIPMFRTWVSFAAGLSRQPFGAFLLYSTMGIIVWNTALILSGYYLYASGVATYVLEYLWLLPIAVSAITLGVIFLRRRKRRAAGV